MLGLSWFELLKESGVHVRACVCMRVRVRACVYFCSYEKNRWASTKNKS